MGGGGTARDAPAKLTVLLHHDVDCWMQEAAEQQAAMAELRGAAAEVRKAATAPMAKPCRCHQDGRARLHRTSLILLLTS